MTPHVLAALLGLALASGGCAARYPGGASAPTPWTPGGGPDLSAPSLDRGPLGPSAIGGPPQDAAGLTPGAPAPAPVVVPPPGPSTSVTTIAGNGGQGLVDGGAGTAQFREPTGVAVGPDGSTYVADTNDFAIRKIAPDGTVSTLAGGTLGRADGRGALAQFFGPTDVTYAPDGNLYVADFDHVRKVALDGTVTTVGITRADGLKYVEIFGIAADPTGFLVLTTLHRVDRVGQDGIARAAAGATVAGFQDGSALTARFNLPHGVAVDAQGTAWVADFGNHAVRKVARDGTVTTAAGTGVLGYVDGPAATARFDFPAGLALGSAGRVFVADTYDRTLRVLDAAGQVRTVAGSPTVGYADGPGSSALFALPAGIAFAPDGTLRVADVENQRIRMVSGL